MFARSAWAVQTLLVALSRRMCCSRVCRAMRRADLPAASRETPMIRPGIILTRASRTAMNAACGPPLPRGTPKRCAEPIAMSAPKAPGEAIKTSASGSQPTVTTAPRDFSVSMTPLRSRTRPSVSGFCKWAPKQASPASSAICSAVARSTVMPSPCARVRSTAITCGWAAASTR